MILQNPAIDVDPYKFKGIVDIYQAYGKWLARMWPRPPNHPRTPAQLKNWGRFSVMISIRSRFNPGYILQWKQIRTPPQRSYDDIWRSGCMKTLNDPSAGMYPGYSSNICRGGTSYITGGGPEPFYYYYFDMYQVFPYACGNLSYSGLPVVMFSDQPGSRVDWAQNGYLCYRGKRQIPHYIPVHTGFSQIMVPGFCTLNQGDAYLDYVWYRNIWNSRVAVWNANEFSYYESGSSTNRDVIESIVRRRRVLHVIRRYMNPLQKVDSYIYGTPPCVFDYQLPMASPSAPDFDYQSGANQFWED